LDRNRDGSAKTSDGSTIPYKAATLANLPPNERRPEVAQKLAGLAAMPDVFARWAVVRALGV
jgi:hypothetical protein